jgi:radical SAM superfamily enzyme YgiQ (UPF0313 family)
MRRNMWELPHWMTWLAGVLVDRGYHSLTALDLYSAPCAQTRLDQTRVLRSLLEQPADVYLFSPMTPNLNFALQIADLVKQVSPSSTTVFGGVVATPLCREVATHPSVDFVVHGRGEYALPDLLDALRGTMDLRRVGNLCYCADSGEIVVSDHTYPWMSPEQIPFPKVDLFPSDVGLDLRYLRQVYGLGCPYQCKFCTIQTIGRKAQYFPIERVVAEIRAYRAQYSLHHNIYFGDETFTLNRARTLAICSALEEQGDVFYDCQTRVNLLDDTTILGALERSGCRWVEVGLEAADQATQDIFKQRVQLRSLTDILKRLRDCGLPTCSFLVNGFPNQTLDEMRQSIDTVGEMLAKGLLHATYLFGLVPYPGSEIYEHPDRYGMTIQNHDYQRYHEDMIPVYDTTHASAEQIYEVFLYGVEVLGQAMDTKPYLGEAPAPTAAGSFGAFWEEAHV